jgi:hypothetical protein
MGLEKNPLWNLEYSKIQHENNHILKKDKMKEV